MKYWMGYFWILFLLVLIAVGLWSDYREAKKGSKSKPKR